MMVITGLRAERERDRERTGVGGEGETWTFVVAGGGEKPVQSYTEQEGGAFSYSSLLSPLTLENVSE